MDSYYRGEYDVQIEALKCRVVGLFIFYPIYAGGEQCSGLYGVTRSDNFTQEGFLVFSWSFLWIFLYSGMSAATK